MIIILLAILFLILSSIGMYFAFKPAEKFQTEKTEKFQTYSDLAGYS